MAFNKLFNLESIRIDMDRITLRELTLSILLEQVSQEVQLHLAIFGLHFLNLLQLCTRSLVCFEGFHFFDHILPLRPFDTNGLF